MKKGRPSSGQKEKVRVIRKSFDEDVKNVLIPFDESELLVYAENRLTASYIQKRERVKRAFLLEACEALRFLGCENVPSFQRVLSDELDELQYEIEQIIEKAKTRPPRKKQEPVGV